jgi:hypothetical protein
MVVALSYLASPPQRTCDINLESQFKGQGRKYFPEQGQAAI